MGPSASFIPCPPFLTDFYQVTMAYAYWKSGRSEMPAVFTLYFRSNPFQGGYAVAAGLDDTHFEGITYNPLKDEWSRNPDTDVNYLLSAKKARKA